MSHAVTMKQLEGIVARINKTLGADPEPYTRLDDGTLNCNAGTWLVGQSYGGYQVQVMAEGGGVHCPLGGGIESRRAVYDKLQAFLYGLNYRQSTLDQSNEGIKS